MQINTAKVHCIMYTVKVHYREKFLSESGQYEFSSKKYINIKSTYIYITYLYNIIMVEEILFLIYFPSR